MIITEEMIRKVQERVDVSYEDAERYLRRAKGNIDKAVYMAKTNKNSSWDSFKEDVRNLLNNIFQYKLLILRNKKTIINLPIVLILFFFLILGGSVGHRLFIFFLGLLIALVAECEIRIDKDSGYNEKKSAQTKPDVNSNKSTSGPVEQKVNPIPPQETVEVQVKEVYNNKEDECYEIVIDE